MQGEFVQCHGTQTRARELFLFTDILIVTKRKDENTYLHRHVIDLSKYRVAGTPWCAKQTSSRLTNSPISSGMWI